MVRVERWGDSLAVRLPETLVEHRLDPAPAEALARLEALARPLPPGFRFSRDEANER